METAHGHWGQFYKAVTFPWGNSTYLLGVADGGSDYFIGELTPDGGGINNRASTSQLENFSASTLVQFMWGQNPYIFMQSKQSNRDWRIYEVSEIKETGALWLKLSAEPNLHFWQNYYQTALAFIDPVSNLCLFAQSTTGNYWFVSQLDPTGSGLDTEVAQGQWSNYYGTAVIFTENGKTYLFAQTEEDGNRWFISELSVAELKAKSEKAFGGWSSYYGTAVTFIENGKTYLFAHSDKDGNRWFISELTADGSRINHETSSGGWHSYYGTAVTFVYGGKTYLFAQSKYDGNRWFIAELTSDGRYLKS